MADRESDRQVLATMASYGADLRKPAHTIHYLYFTSRSATDAAACELRAAGYQNVTTDRAPSVSLWKRLFGPKQYSCIAETHAVPTESAVFATTDTMNRLAQKHAGV